MNPRPKASAPTPERVHLVEVGPRDGLQNEKTPVPTEVKLELIRRLERAGLAEIEATAFVAPRWVPQMADHDALLRAVLTEPAPGVAYPVLVPNLKGLDAAMAAGARSVAVFGAASETFSQKNIHCSMAESLARFEPVVAQARHAGLRVRAYVSCVAGCPYEGPIAPAKVAHMAKALFEMGCEEISLGDTVGTGTPNSIRALLDAVMAQVPVTALAGHYHDTYGMAIANIQASFECGLRIFDASVAGLGGCPYATGASGNVATEDVVWLFESQGIPTGIDLGVLVETAHWISAALGKKPASRVASALLGGCATA
jgi:hydroxymethylglutaryl-CoA lyase